MQPGQVVNPPAVSQAPPTSAPQQQLPPGMPANLPPGMQLMMQNPQAQQAMQQQQAAAAQQAAAMQAQGKNIYIHISIYNYLVY